MKVKFTKLAALLLAGAALFATGCTDYEVDIQKVDKKVDDLISGKVATLESQVAQLQATVATLESKADHDADIQNLRKQITDLQAALDADIASLKDRVKAIEDANFQAQINDLTTKYQQLKDEKADKTELAKVEADLKALINGEIGKLDTRLTAAEAAIEDIKTNLIPALQTAIDEINNVTIPALKTRIEAVETGKLDKAEFTKWLEEEYGPYKTATANTLKLMQASINDLIALTAGFPEDTTIKEYVDGAIKTLADTFMAKYAEVIAKAFGSEEKMKAMEGDLLGRLEALEALLDGEWGGKTVQQYIQGKVDELQAQIDDIVKVQLPELKDRVSKLEKTVNDVIMPEIKFAIGYEGYYSDKNGLQGYIQDWAIDAYLSACEYADEWGNYLLDFIEDLYVILSNVQTRIQSIVYVPDYDDLKITSNMTIVTAMVEAMDEAGEPTGEYEEVATVMDQPTKITYKLLPAKWAKYAADYYKDNLVFDVKPVNTRAEEEPEPAKVPALNILAIEYDAATIGETGEVTFTVMPENIASMAFAAYDLRPQYNVQFRAGGIPGILDGYHVWGTDHESRGEVGYGENYTWSVPVWKYDELKKYEARATYAASLRMKVIDSSTAIYNYEDDDTGYNPDYPEYNEVASPYNVLYPGVTKVDIPGEPYKPSYDEEGKPKKDEDGYALLEPAMEEHQQLPYSSLRDNPAGEKKTQDPKGYRVILDESIPAVIINGGEPMTFEDAAQKYGIILPEYSIEFKEFTYTNEENAEKPLYIGTEKVYAEVEMNGDFSAAERMVAIGDFITGFYTYNVGLGSFEGWGDVEITPALGEVAVDAVIPWTWAYDAIVDHNLFYPDEQVADDEGNNPTVYTRVKFPININAEDAKYLEDNLAITLESFSHKEPTSFEVTVTETVKDPDTGAESEVEVDPAPSMTIDGVTIEDGELFANFTFEQAGWDKTYNIVAVYDLGDAIITVTGTLVTIDRNREKVVLGPYEHTFIVNGEEYYDGYYHWSSEAMHKDIFEAFDAEGVINVPENTEGDFEFDADQDDFNEGELTGFLRMADPSGTAKGYVDFNRNDIILNTLPTLTPEVLAGELFNSGERDADDPNLWIGNIVTRNVTTFIGEEVEMQMKFNYKVPDYNFLHLRFYTWNTEKEHADFITLRNFDDNDGSVLWWSQVYPSYFNDVPAQGAAPTQEGRVSNRYALADYDVEYINLAELAFNVVDDKDKIINDQDLAALGLTPKFVYTDKEQNSVELPEVDQFDPDYLIYEDLWKSATVFYYRTNEKKFIPALGELTLTVGTPGENGNGGFEFPVATRFEFPKASVDYPEEILDYSTYAMVRWTPFKAPVAKDVTIVLDENKIYREPLFKGMTLMDNRPNDVSFYVIKEGEWVVGNAAADATAASKKNGYLTDVVSKDAYHITTDFVYDTTGIPADLKKLLKIEVENGTPYVVYDYTSQVEFYGVVTMPVVVKLENPWQETLNFSYNIIIKGVNN